MSKKTSMKILLNDECIMTVGFRNIKESIFIDAGTKLKFKLYYKCQQ